MEGDVAELAHHGVVAAGHEGVEILEEEDRRLDLLQHLVERHQWVLGRRIALARLHAGAGRHPPVQVHSKSFFCRLAAMRVTISSARSSSLVSR